MGLPPPTIAAQVRTVGLYLPPQPKASSAFYKRSMGKPMDWHLWLRLKVSAMVGFMTSFRDGAPSPASFNSKDAWSLDTYSW